MKVTPQQMRKSVTGWLTEERATVEEAIQLQAAIEAGAIAGGSYKGDREGADDLIKEVANYQDDIGEEPEDPFGEEDEDRDCGCLIDTLERIKNNRPIRNFKGATAEAFSLALMIGLGDTPANSRWARAAVKGIEDYLAALEVAA